MESAQKIERIGLISRRWSSGYDRNPSGKADKQKKHKASPVEPPLPHHRFPSLRQADWSKSPQRHPKTSHHHRLPRWRATRFRVDLPTTRCRVYYVESSHSRRPRFSHTFEQRGNDPERGRRGRGRGLQRVPDLLQFEIRRRSRIPGTGKSPPMSSSSCTHRLPVLRRRERRRQMMAAGLSPSPHQRKCQETPRHAQAPVLPQQYRKTPSCGDRCTGLRHLSGIFVGSWASMWVPRLRTTFATSSSSIAMDA